MASLPESTDPVRVGFQPSTHAPSRCTLSKCLAVCLIPVYLVFVPSHSGLGTLAATYLTIAIMIKYHTTPSVVVHISPLYTSGYVCVCLCVWRPMMVFRTRNYPVSLPVRISLVFISRDSTCLHTHTDRQGTHMAVLYVCVNNIYDTRLFTLFNKRTRYSFFFVSWLYWYAPPHPI